MCNIDGGTGAKVQVNQLLDGIKLNMGGEVEKRSDKLNKNTVFDRKAKISRLPKYLAIQPSRFFWKATPESQDHRGISCKILRPVAMPDVIDMYDLCISELQTELEKARKNTNTTNTTNTSSAVAAAAVSASNAMDMEMDEDLRAALALSMNDTSNNAVTRSSSSASASEPGTSGNNGTRPVLGYSLPEGFKGRYELKAIVTHKGRSADSGHYMAWVKDTAAGADKGQKTKWFVFDDDSVSETDTEYVLSHLKGGGDDHMSVMCFYAACTK